LSDDRLYAVKFVVITRKPTEFFHRKERKGYKEKVLVSCTN